MRDSFYLNHKKVLIKIIVVINAPIYANAYLLKEMSLSFSVSTPIAGVLVIPPAIVVARNLSLKKSL